MCGVVRYRLPSPSEVMDELCKRYKDANGVNPCQDVMGQEMYLLGRLHNLRAWTTLIFFQVVINHIYDVVVIISWANTEGWSLTAQGRGFKSCSLVACIVTGV